MCFHEYTEHRPEHTEVYLAVRAAGLDQKQAGLYLKQLFGLTSVLDAKRIVIISEKTSDSI